MPEEAPQKPETPADLQLINRDEQVVLWRTLKNVYGGESGAKEALSKYGFERLSEIPRREYDFIMECAAKDAGVTNESIAG